MPDAVAAGSRRTMALLALGAAVGVGLAVASLTRVGEARRELAADVVAVVNGQPIRTVDYLRAVSALAADRRSPLTAADRRRVLDRLIDEELLVQYGVALGLVRSDRRVRGDLVSAVLAAQVASVDGYEPSREEMRAFYEEHADFFATAARLRLAVLWFGGVRDGSDDEAMAEAAAAAAALRGGEDAAAVGERFADDPVAPLPDGYLPPAKIREYLGPSVTNAALELETGEVSEPIRAGGGVYVVQVLDREAGGAPPFAEVEEQVRAEMRRRAGDRAVRATLESLREQGQVIVGEELP